METHLHDLLRDAEHVRDVPRARVLHRAPELVARRDRFAQRDLRDPRGERRARPELRQVRVRGDVRLLHRVLDVGVVTEHAPHEPLDEPCTSR